MAKEGSLQVKTEDCSCYCRLLLRILDNQSRSDFRRGIPLRLGFSAPFLRVRIVHFFHLYRDSGMLFRHVLHHGFNHLVPRAGREPVIARSAHVLTG
jgi:hypothetical protein